MRAEKRILIPVLVLAAAAATAKEEPLDLRSVDQKVVAPLNVAAMNRLTTAALSGTPAKLGGFVYAFDRRLDTAYEASQPGKADIIVGFAKAQPLHSLRVLIGDQTGRAAWSVAVAESYVDLERGAGTFREVIPPRDRLTVGSWDDGKLAGLAPVKVLRLTIIPADPKSVVSIRECNLLGEQTLEALSLKSPSSALPMGQAVPLEVYGHFSGGEARLITGKALKWNLTPMTAARMGRYHQITGTRRGPLDVRVQFDQLLSPPLALEVVDAD